MNRVTARWVFAFLLILTLAVLLFLGAQRQPAAVQARLVGLPVLDSTGFARAMEPVDLVFPRDLGPHPDYQTEWWYYTGNLQDADGRRFGYQLTFFRRAVTPPDQRAERRSDWAVEQVYLGHFALTDVSGQRFYAFERLERGAAGLAGAAGEPVYSVWLHDWSVEQVGPDAYQLEAAEENVRLSLALRDLKGPVLQGDRGLSQKGPEPGNASIYYSQTRLESAGTIWIGGQAYAVTGLSWLDREFSTSVLSPGQIGWDWFSLQFDDGSELMTYVLRRDDGSVDVLSKGLYIAPDGTTQLLRRDDVQIEVTGQWASPHSKGVYPSGWQLLIDTLGLEVEIVPLLKDQELNLSYTYWEGAVQARGQRGGQAIAGFGYVELTGYAASMEGQF